jgi:hypothetical protein
MVRGAHDRQPLMSRVGTIAVITIPIARCALDICSIVAIGCSK